MRIAARGRLAGTACKRPVSAALQRRESLGAHCRTDATPTMRYRMATIN
jgi:aspartate oxidase